MRNNSTRLGSSLLFLHPAVLLGMLLGSLTRVVGRLQSVPMRNLGMMASLLVISRFVMLGSFTMVFGRVLVMLGRFVVVFSAFVCRHLWLPGE